MSEVYVQGKQHDYRHTDMRPYFCDYQAEK